MGATIREIADRIAGVLDGDPAIAITGMAGLRDAGPGDISFLANSRYASEVATTGAAAVIVNSDWQGQCPGAVIRVDNADEAFAVVAAMLAAEPRMSTLGVHPASVVADDVKLGQDVSIGPCCTIEAGAVIGDRTVICAGCYVGHDSVIGVDCRLYPNVCIREGTLIGDRVIMHMGAVVGSDGFGYVRKGARWEKIPQVGIVEIQDDAEIGANVTIDRARFGKTIIGKGSKIDNLVQIAHNVVVGENTAIAAQVGISGSTTIGSGVQMGGQAGVAGHIRVGDNSVVAGQAGVTKDVAPQTFVSGYPATPHQEAQRLQASVRRLPVLKRKLADLEERLKKLEQSDT